jgi:Ulp1 family protease
MPFSHGVHHIGVHIDLELRQIAYYDSLQREEDPSIMDGFREHWALLYSSLMGADVDWNLVRRECPQQEDGSNDCAAFAASVLDVVMEALDQGRDVEDAVEEYQAAGVTGDWLRYIIARALYPGYWT